MVKSATSKSVEKKRVTETALEKIKREVATVLSKPEHQSTYATVQQVSKITGISSQYLVGSLFAESTLKSPKRGKSKTGDHEPVGMAQIKPIAWKEALKDKRFQQHWDQLTLVMLKDWAEGIENGRFLETFHQFPPIGPLPSGPGQSVEADIMAMAVLTMMGENKCGIDELEPEDQKDKAARLCYHLNAKTAKRMIDTLKTGKKVKFNSPENQNNWNRFLVSYSYYASPMVASAK